eukprot:13579285-Heterocapsa_arctica.AAC.1
MGQQMQRKSPNVDNDNMTVVRSFVKVTRIRFEYHRIRTQYKLGGPNGTIYKFPSTSTCDGTSEDTP